MISLLFFACSSKPRVANDAEQTDTLSREERILCYKNTIDSINKSLCWNEIGCGLWKSKNGDLALKIVEWTDVNTSIDKYIMCLADFRPLNKVVDTTTFRYLGSSFYGDKNHIYTHYMMVDGGFFQIVEDADVETFRIIGACYAKDKNYIFGERAMRMDSVDYKTFKTCDECGCFAKDKNAYYFWDEKIDTTNIEDEEILKIIEQLRKL
ncbi:MAG: hypothetical protein ACK5IQ_08870 [Bacteroidales bacterium]